MWNRHWAVKCEIFNEPQGLRNLAPLQVVKTLNALQNVNGAPAFQTICKPETSSMEFPNSHSAKILNGSWTFSLSLQAILQGLFINKASPDDNDFIYQKLPKYKSITSFMEQNWIHLQGSTFLPTYSMFSHPGWQDGPICRALLFSP